MHRLALGRSLLIVGAQLAAANCASVQIVEAGSNDCGQMTGKQIAAAAIALPTSGARVSSAEWVVEADGRPAFCRVLGEIAPVDREAPPVLFQVNLPQLWNRKAVQIGGGGLNGTLVTGEQPLKDQPPIIPPPLAQGYVTFGTDAGHPNAKPDIQIFALNREALENHAFGAYKKTHDVAVSLVKAMYGSAPRRTYYFGHSEGGREALLVAQRYPADYDGVVSIVPVHSWTMLQLAGYEQWRTFGAAAPLSEDQLKYITRQVLEACDERDGLRDGIVSQYRGCDQHFSVASLACRPENPVTDQCLSQPQVAAVERVQSRYELGYALEHGVSSYPAFGHGGEAQAGGYVPRLLSMLALGDVRYFVVKDPAFAGALDTNAYRDRIQELSRLLDATDPDLSAFKARGGKVIMKENTADYVQSAETGFSYYDSVSKGFGAKATADFVRMYVTPGANHNGNGTLADGSALPDRTDLLAVLDDWVEGRRAAPKTLEQSAHGASAPFDVLATRPMCSYPEYPHYAGSGDVRSAASFTCRPVPSH